MILPYHKQPGLVLGGKVKLGLRPLAEALRAQNLKVWYDEYSLKLGDGLRESIDSGLRRSRYGVVVLSKAFFQKNWPKRELEALATKERNGIKIILPIWHGVGLAEVEEYSPMLSGRVAIETTKGIDEVVKKVIEVVSPSST